MDDSVLYEIHQNFGHNIGRDDQLDIVWEKATKEEEGVDTTEAISQAEQRTKKKIDALSSKATTTQ